MPNSAVLEHALIVLAAAKEQITTLDASALHSQGTLRQNFGKTEIVRDSLKGAINVYFAQDISPWKIMEKSWQVFDRAGDVQKTRQTDIKEQMRRGRDENGKLGLLMYDWLDCRSLLTTP